MSIATYLIVLLLSPCVLFMTLVIWLAHILDGYPAFMISHACRGVMQFPKRLFLPNGSTVLEPLAHTRLTPRPQEFWTATAQPRVDAAANRNKTNAI